MPAMRRADRGDHNRDNAINHPHSRREEPTSSRELKQLLMTARSQRDEWQQRAQENQEAATQLVHVQQLLQTSQFEVTELLTKYEEAEAQRVQYLTLYNEAQAQLKYERRSKASIKGWETRRKLENERLKQEIGEMTVLLRESLARKDDAVNNLYLLAERMDRIQQLVDSVEEELPDSPVGLLQKFRRIWLVIKDVLAE